MRLDMRKLRAQLCQKRALTTPNIKDCVKVERTDHVFDEAAQMTRKRAVRFHVVPFCFPTVVVLGYTHLPHVYLALIESVPYGLMILWKTNSLHPVGTSAATYRRKVNPFVFMKVSISRGVAYS